MAELELDGLHADGEHLVLVGGDGTRFRLRIDDALRAAVRRDRPQLGQLRSADQLRPRDIQARIRAGASAEDVAYESGLTLDHVRRYEGPVIAERTYVAERGRTIPVGRESGAPSLADLVVDRLAGRGVTPEDLAWTAVRRAGESWELVLTFRAAGRDREARWTVDLPSRSFHALDDEGRWLTELELGSGRRHLSPVSSGPISSGPASSQPATPAPDAPDEPAPDVYDVEADEPPPAPVPESAAPATTADLLEELSASRGVRQEVARLDDDEVALAEEEPAPSPSARPAATSGKGSTGGVVALPVAGRTSGSEARPGRSERGGTPSGPGSEGPRPRNRSRSRRTSVPSWDEIVFGAKPE